MYIKLDMLQSQLHDWQVHVKQAHVNENIQKGQRQYL